ncbi:hypothetical protein NSP_10050 [Nodularia spumigena CCY9414]|nr:hypothetical protein NSP_10050 [Nodularia spumigena CCY9414]
MTNYTHLLFWHSPDELQSLLDAQLLWGLPPLGFFHLILILILGIALG